MQGIHKELKIFLKKMLNLTFNQELKFCKRENMNLEGNYAI